MNIGKDILFTRLLWTVFFVLLAVIFLFSLGVKFNRDEIESIHASWKIFSGQRIYVDFFEHHHPFFYYMLAPLIGIFKENIAVLVAARVLVFLMLLLIFAVTFNISKNLFGKEPAIISLVLLSTTNVFIWKAVEIRPDVPQTLFGLLSIAFLFSYFQKNSLKHLILSSIFLGVSFLFLQKSIFLVFIIGVLILLSVCTNKIKFKDAFLYLLIFTATLIPYFVYLIFRGQIHTYLIYNWSLNVGIEQHRASWSRTRAILALLSSFKDNPLLWIFWLLSLPFLETPNQVRIGAISLFLLIIYFSIQLPFLQYLMLVTPLIAVMAGNSICQVANVFPKNKVLIICVIVSIYIFNPLKSYLKTVSLCPNAAQLRKMEYVLSITKATDFVYDGSPSFNLFRNDLDFFWISRGKAILKTVDNTPYQYDFDELVDKFNPKVISRSQIWNMNDDRIVNNYRKSDKYPDIFIRIK